MKEKKCLVGGYRQRLQQRSPVVGSRMEMDRAQLQQSMVRTHVAADGVGR
jgi:hypothetical protein